jgi:hypothetical protein
MSRRIRSQQPDPPQATGFAAHNLAWPYCILPLLALIAVVPLIVHGSSCGHDFDFHLQSWLDAAAQMRHGAVDPSWTISAAWNTGEPRFLFYPPLSWILGAVLSLVLPFSVVPVVFTWVALCGAAFTMYRLARAYAPPAAALLAGAAYIANPYILFTAFERTAYGELLAAVWMPLLIGAALRTQPNVLGIAVPIALLWLSNAPAAVIGVYTLAAIALLRISIALFARDAGSARSASRRRAAAGLLWQYAAGGALGLTLSAFYLLPAAYERRYVQVAMAIIPNMRVQDNFLFGHTGDGPHDRVLHTASIIAVCLLVIAAATLVAAWLTRLRGAPGQSSGDSERSTLVVLAVATAVVAFLLTPISLPVWLHIPELAFLQFPWRLLCLLGVVFALGVAFAFSRLLTNRTALAASLVAAFVIVTAMTAWCITDFRQPCEATDRPDTRAALFRTHHGIEPTDEYTPTDADNDVLRWDDPPYWIAPDPTAFAPGTVPNPAATIVNYDAAPPVEQTIAGIAPHHLRLQLPRPETLILNLRDYPSWEITRNDNPVVHRLQRDDGLLAIALPAGVSTIDIRWRRMWDQLLGDIISAGALLLVIAIYMRSRTIKADA